MGPERWKGELPPDEAAEADRAGRGEEQGEGASRESRSDDVDRREEEGYGQPESSAQKAPRPEDEMLGE